MCLIEFLLCSLFIIQVCGVTEGEYRAMPEIFYLDDFDYCMSLEENALYCSVTIQLAPISKNHSKVWKTISEVITLERNYRHDWLRHGICVQEYCPKLSSNISLYKTNTTLLRREISKCYSEKLLHKGLEGYVTNLHCETNKSFYPWTIYDSAVGVVVIAIVLVVGFSSLYESYVKLIPEKKAEDTHQFMLSDLMSCFSVFKNWEIFTTLNTDPETAPLNCMEGFRFCSSVLVVAAHTVFMQLSIGIVNPMYHETATQQPQNMLFMNGSYLVQTYFLMTGWLLTYHFFNTFEERQSGKTSYFVQSFINKYIRMTPSLLLVIAIDATLLYHLGRGPYWDEVVGDNYRNCRMNWWANILYINNYYDVEHICIQQSWYFSADLQLFLLSIIIIALMWKYERYAKLILAVCIVISIVLPGVVNYVSEYDMLVREYPEPMYRYFLTVPEWTVMYTAGYTNMGGFIIGVTFGYIYYKTKERELFTTKFHVALWWIMTWILPLGAIFIAAPIYQDTFVYTRLGAAAFVSTGRNLFALGMAVCILGMTRKVGWLMRSCVLFPPVQIMGKLSYCVFLSHFALIRVRVGQTRTLSYVNTYDLILLSIGDIVLSYLVGLILYFCVEMPTAALQKLLSKKWGDENHNKGNIPLIEESGLISKF